MTNLNDQSQIISDEQLARRVAKHTLARLTHVIELDVGLVTPLARIMQQAEQEVREEAAVWNSLAALWLDDHRFERVRERVKEIVNKRRPGRI